MKSISSLVCRRTLSSLMMFGLMVAGAVLPTQPVAAQSAIEQLKEFRVEVPAELPAHPRLFLTPKKIVALKAMIEREEWLGEFVDKFLKRTRKRLDDYTLPEDKGGSERKIASTANNRAISTQANEFALAYVLTDDIAFAKATAEILKAYIPLYKYYAVTNTKGKAMSSTLDETRWAADYASAYDLVYQAGVLSDEEKQAIEQEVLKPCGNVLRICNHHYRSNWRARAFAGVGLVGFCINDRELIDEAIHGFRDEEGLLRRDGFVQHVAWSVAADGIFYERSFGYQAFTADSYFLLLEAAHNSGVDLWNVEVPGHPYDAGSDVERVFGKIGPKSIQPMFDALFYRTFSDGTVPVVANAGSDWFVRRRYYEAAWREYQDPKYALAARIPGHVARPWDNPETSERIRVGSPTDLQWLVPELPAGSFDLADDTKIGRNGRHENACTFFPNGGYAMLRESADPNAVGVGMTFGRWGSGHSHADKLSIVVNDGTHKAIREVKGFGYGDREYLTWDRQTIAHNTVTVDETSQAPQGAGEDSWAIPRPGTIVRGKPLLFHPGEKMKVFRAECLDGYEGVRQERTLVLVDSVLVDFFRNQSDEVHTYDYALHIEGKFPNFAPDVPGPLSEAFGYKHITELRRATGPRVMSFNPGGHISLLSPGEVTTGLGIKTKKGQSAGKQRSVLVQRQRGKNVDFVSVISFGETPADASRVSYPVPEGQVVELAGGLKVQNTDDGVLLIDAEGNVLEQAMMTK